MTDIQGRKKVNRNQRMPKEKQNEIKDDKKKDTNKKVDVTMPTWKS